jgi:hypothetical protein
MQELTPIVAIQQNALGLYTGIVQTTEGNILIDSPYRTDDHKAWGNRATKSDAIFLVLLDTQYDRTLSAKGCDCIILSQSDYLLPSKPRQQAVKLQEELLGGGDSHEQSGSPTRPYSPEISFDQNMSLSFGVTEVLLEHHPGSNLAGIWAILPQEKVIFVGDSVMVNQPPFMAYCDPAAWAADLKLLASRAYKGYQIVSSRAGLITQDQVREMGKLMTFIQNSIASLREKNADLDTYLELIPRILKRIEYSPAEGELFFNRLRWGLTTYYELNQA